MTHLELRPSPAGNTVHGHDAELAAPRASKESIWLWCQNAMLRRVEWLLLVLGALLGVTVDKIYDWARRRSEDRRRTRHYEFVNKRREQVQSLHPNIQLLQAGWDPNGFYVPGSAIVRVRGRFETPPEIEELVESHRQQWIDGGAKNNPQIGIRSFRVDRVSDDPADDRAGTAHQLVFQGHEFEYFEFLASHRLLVEGNESERATITRLAADASATTPAAMLPTPISVGLTVLAEQGDILILSRRATTQSHAGSWAGGRVFNAVGEGAAPRDLASAGHDADATSPEVVAARGLYEELGFRTQDMVRTRIRLHSYAYDSSILDFKFFGVAETSLSFSEVHERWLLAPDRSEASELIQVPIRSKGDCLALLAKIADEHQDWSAEALFSTIRTLLCLERVRVQDVIDCIAKSSDADGAHIRATPVRIQQSP